MHVTEIHSHPCKVESINHTLKVHIKFSSVYMRGEVQKAVGESEPGKVKNVEVEGNVKGKQISSIVQFGLGLTAQLLT